MQLLEMYSLLYDQERALGQILRRGSYTSEQRRIIQRAAEADKVMGDGSPVEVKIRKVRAK
jgi:hypothetical protein